MTIYLSSSDEELVVGPSMDISQRHQYKAVCRCGWESGEWTTVRLARIEAAGHEMRSDHSAVIVHISDASSHLPERDEHRSR